MHFKMLLSVKFSLFDKIALSKTKLTWRKYEFSKPTTS